MRILHWLTIAALASGALWAAADPLAGKWQVNASRSKLNDEMTVEAAGGNRYAFRFSPAAVETIVLDGTDQPGIRGSTLSVAAEGPNRWIVVRKIDGKTVVTAHWTLAADGKTLTDDYTGYKTDGSQTTVHYLYQRTAGTDGFAGTWDSDSQKLGSVFAVQIAPSGNDGLSVTGPGAETSMQIRLDGNDYPDVGPRAPAGSTSSARRVSQRGVEVTQKVQGKITETRRLEVSPDLQTLTITDQLAGQRRPKSILVFDRQ